MSSNKQTPIHALPLAMSGIVGVKLALLKIVSYLDKALPAPFSAADIGKVATVVTDGNGGAQTAWAVTPDLPAFTMANAGMSLKVTNVSGVATLAWA